MGTPIELVTPDGRISWKTAATLLGDPTNSSADDDLDCPLSFPGQHRDAETGLNYNLHRYYDPGTAAYLTPDPLGLTAAPNTVEWSWRWNGPTSDVTKTIRAATNPAVKAAVNALPWT